LNFEGVQTILEKSDNFCKIPSSHDILEYELILTHLYSNIESFFTSGRRDLLYFLPKRAGHVSILLPLSQFHHCTKLGKKCSKLNYRYETSIQLTCIHHIPRANTLYARQNGRWATLPRPANEDATLISSAADSLCPPLALLPILTIGPPSATAFPI
jgi:hypothetical protein